MNPSELPIALTNLSKMWARFEGRNPVWKIPSEEEIAAGLDRMGKLLAERDACATLMTAAFEEELRFMAEPSQ